MSQHFASFSKALLVFLLVIFTTNQLFAKDFPPDYEEMLMLLTTSPRELQKDPKVIREATKYLIEHPSIEARQMLRNRIISELKYAVKKPKFPEYSQTILTYLFQALVEMGNVQDAELAFGTSAILKKRGTKLNPELQQALLDATLKFGNEDFVEPELKSAMDSMREVARQKMSEARAIVDASNPMESATRILDQFSERMNQAVVGQEEIVDALRRQTLKDLLLGGYRERPEVYYLMGLPANGKDTIVEAYVDALHGVKGAHEKHMFKIETNNSAEIWSLLGSATGYIGSEELPDFLRFLVEHSGGKYQIVFDENSGQKGRYVVERNPNYSEDILTLDGNKPHKAVIFVNEAHNIPKSVKDSLLKKAMERGHFPIKNPGASEYAVSEIVLPVTFIFASNEGIELIEPREANGTRVGKPLPYEELLANWERVHDDKAKLKGAILKTNGRVNSPNEGRDAPGVSEEWLSRVPVTNLFILKPTSPNGLQDIARQKIEQEFSVLRKAKGNLGNFEVEVSDALVEFLQKYDYVPSENARPIISRVREFIIDPFYWAMEKGRLKINGETAHVQLDIKQYNSGAAALVFNVKAGEKEYSFSRLLKATLSKIPPQPISDERIEEIVKMRDVINSNVFGVEHIVDQLTRTILIAESEGQGAKNGDNAPRPATLMGFFGKSSVGKTELAKQFTKARYGTVEAMKIVDFNKVNSAHDMKVKITGTYDGVGNPIPSEFMKAYDRAQNGEVIFVFDELANAPKELLKTLYEIFREPVVTDFVDGKPRYMGNVTIILTGNVGEIIYQALPKDLPADVKERAQLEAFDVFMRDPNLQYEVLLQHFTDALIARMAQNVFWFSPLKPKAKRQLVQLKLKQALASVEPKASERGWKIQFQSNEDLIRLIEIIEKEGFTAEHQGAALDRYVRESFKDRLKFELIGNKVANGDTVVISVPEQNEAVTNERGVESRTRTVTLHLANGKEVPLVLPGRQLVKEPRTTDTTRTLTAFHEIGHELTSKVYFGDAITPAYLSIIPGVSLIGNRFVYYAGIKVGEYETQVRLTKEAVLRHVAINAAGYVAEDLMSVGEKSADGKSNDMMRATDLILEAILRYGLSDEWGTKTIPDPTMSSSDFIEKHLSDEEKQQLNKIVRRWLKDGEKLARRAILVNLSTSFIPMSHLLAAKGHLDKAEIVEFYGNHEVITERDSAFTEELEKLKALEGKLERALKSKEKGFHTRFVGRNFTEAMVPAAYKYLRGWNIVKRMPSWESLSAHQQMLVATILAGFVKDDTRDPRLHSESLIPEKVANIEDLLEARKQAELKDVSNDKFADRLFDRAALGISGNSCSKVFTF